MKRWLVGLVAVATFLGISPNAYTESEMAAESSPITSLPEVKPYRTFITIKRYDLENSGIPSKPVSTVKLDIRFPQGVHFQLPEGGNAWSIGNNQSQEINRTFEIPWNFIAKDGFAFEIQMKRKGKSINPCKFDVQQLSQFNRTYICRTDVAYQQNQRISEDKIAKEAIEIRVFSDRNSPAAEIPKDAIALK